jgi:hypothetical protein
MKARFRDEVVSVEENRRNRFPIFFARNALIFLKTAKQKFGIVWKCKNLIVDFIDSGKTEIWKSEEFSWRTGSRRHGRACLGHPRGSVAQSVQSTARPRGLDAGTSPAMTGRALLSPAGGRGLRTMY